MRVMEWLGYPKTKVIFPQNFIHSITHTARQTAPQGLRQRPAQQRTRNLFRAARQPYVDPPHRNDLGRMDIARPHCGALHWLAEKLSSSSKSSPKFGTCCNSGKVHLAPLEDPPEPLRRLLTSDDRNAIKFRDEIWKFTRAFAFTSLGVQEDHSVNQGRGPPVFRISGELHHRSGALAPSDGRLPRYAQLYIYEPRAALESRMRQNEELDDDIMKSLQEMLTHSASPICSSVPSCL